MKKLLFLIIIFVIIVLTSLSISSCTESDEVNNTSQLTDQEEVNDPNNRESTKVISQPGDNTITISSLYPKFSIDFLIQESHAVIIGEVIDILPSIGVDDPYRPGEKMIYTNVIIGVNQYLLGKSQDKQIAIWVCGGRVGDTVMMVADEPIYTVGDEMLLFLRSTDPNYLPPDNFGATNYYYAFAGAQGKYEYKNDTIVSWDGKAFTISEFEQKIAEIRGNK